MSHLRNHLPFKVPLLSGECLLHCGEASHLEMTPFVYFCFVRCTFEVLSRKPLPAPMP